MKLFLDSWAWLEYFRHGPNADLIVQKLTAATGTYTSVLNVFEVCRKLERTEGAEARSRGFRFMMEKSTVLPIGIADSLDALLFGEHEKLHAMDAFTFAMAVNNDCHLLTGDPHFKGKKGVIYVGD